MQGFSTGTNTEVPAHFVPQGNTHYRVVAITDPTKAFTVGKEGNLSISTYISDASQRFVIMPQGNKYAFIVQSTSTALCIHFDNRDNGGVIKSDPGKHDSSWFEINRVPNGEYANKGYAIGTFVAGRCAAIDGGVAKEGVRVIQWEWHTGAGQIWLIVPADQPLQGNQGQGQWGTQSQGWGQQNQPQNQGWGNQSEHGHHGHKKHHGHHGQHGQGPQNQGFNPQNQGFNPQNQGFNPQNQGFNPGFSVDVIQNFGKVGHGQGFGIEMIGNFKKGYTYAFLSAGNENKCIHINHDNHAKIFDFQGTVNQKFTFESYDKEHNTYVIKCVGNGQYLSAGGLFAGVAVVTKPKHEFGEHWVLEASNKFQAKGGAVPYVLRSCSGHPIDVPGGNFNNGSQLEKHGYHGNANQVWYVAER